MAGSYAGGSTLISHTWFSKSEPDFVLYQGDVGGPKGFKSFEDIEAYRALAGRVATLIKLMTAARRGSNHQHRLAEIVSPLLDRLVRLELGKERIVTCARGSGSQPAWCSRRIPSRPTLPIAPRSKLASRCAVPTASVNCRR